MSFSPSKLAIGSALLSTGLADNRFHVTDYMGDGAYPGHRAEKDEAEHYVAAVVDAMGRGDAVDLAAEPRLALVDGYSPALVALDLLGVVEVTDHLVAIGRQRAPILFGPLQSGASTGVKSCLRRAEQRLARDAGPIGALPPDELALAQRNLHPLGNEPRDRCLPGGPRSDDDRVVSVAHLQPPYRCQNMRYSRYQYS